MEDSKKRSMYPVGLSGASSARVSCLALLVFSWARAVSLFPRASTLCLLFMGVCVE